MGLTLGGSLVWAVGMALSFAWPGLIAIAYAWFRAPRIDDSSRYLRFGIPLSYAVIFVAHAWLADRAGVPREDLVVWGRSLGGAVAVDVAGRCGARGLVLDRTFHSMVEVAAGHYPWLPVRRPQSVSEQFGALAIMSKTTLSSPSTTECSGLRACSVN